ncbi:MAG: YitT family protein [Clostridia bacterium]
MKQKILNEIYDIILIIIGTYLVSLSISMFMLPNKITTGGASGIATIIYYLSNVNIGLTVILVNIPLFIIAIIKLGIKFSIKSIISTILLSVFLEVFKYNTSGFDLFISCIFGGIILGIGISIIFKAGASSGGSDMLAQIIKKYTNINNISTLLLSIDFIVILLLVITFKNLSLGLYSLIAIFISSKVIDYIFEGVNFINVITKNDDKITNNILDKLKRGATVTKCIGAYTRDEYINITCIVTMLEISKVKNIVKECDDNALIYITNAHDVYGKGFKNI